MKTITHLLIGLVVLFLTGKQVNATEINISFQSDNLTLNGTLTLPNGPGPFAVAVLAHGSGPNDRNQELVLSGGNAQCLYPGLVNDTLRLFKDLSVALADSGIAVFRYDKRTFTHPGHNPQLASPYDFADDVHAAVNYLKTRPDIDTTRIVLIGQSQGANLMPIVADQRNDIYAVIGMGTPSTRIDTAIASQYRDLYYMCLNDTATGDNTYAQTLSDFNQIDNGTWPLTTPYQGVYPSFWKDWMGMTDSAIIHYDQLNVPALLLQGTDDFNVPVSDAQRFASNLANVDYDLFYLNGLNHHFTTATDPKMAEVTSDTIIYWLRQRNLFTSVAEASLEKQVNSQIVYEAGGVVLQWNESFHPTEIQVFDINGRVVERESVSSAGQLFLPSGKLPKGIYFVYVKADNEYETHKVFLQ